nr:RNA-directed DNA polymerase, eukaryota, reverse transcriptase zinc-binding domain protein [Tanacetum cinerariifolium]
MTDYYSADESSVCSTHLSSLKKLDAPAKDNKSSSALKVNSSPADHLGKFDEKAYDGDLLGYAVSKASESSTLEDNKLKKSITSHLMKALMLSNSQDLQLRISTLLKQEDIHLMNIFILMNLLKCIKQTSIIEPYECIEPVVLETKVSSKQNGQADQNDQSAQTDEILNDDLYENSNPTNDEKIIDNLPNTKDIKISKNFSSPDEEDTSVQNTILIPNPSSSISSIVTPAPQNKWSQYKYIELVNIIGNPGAGMLIRAVAKELSTASAHECPQLKLNMYPVLHSRTKHIDIRYHFIRDHILKGDIELHFIPTQYQLADIFTKPLDELTFKRLIVELGGIRGDICINTFRNALRAHYLPHSSMYVSQPSITIVRPWFATISYSKEIEAKGTLKKSCLPPRGGSPRKKAWSKKWTQKKQSSKHTPKSKTEASKSKTGQLEKETQSSSSKDKSPIHPLPPTPVVDEMHKEAQQAAGGLTSLGATSKDRAHPQLSSDSTTEADPGLSTPNDSIPSQKDTSIPHPLSLKSAQIQELMAQIQLLWSQKDELEQQKAKAKSEVASLKARPSYPDIKQLTTLLEIEDPNITMAEYTQLEEEKAPRRGQEFICATATYGTVRWKSVLAAKDVDGLGVSSLFALNRALMFKWVWRFFSQKNSLCVRVVKALHGEDGKIGKKVQPRYPSTWLNIINQIESLKLHGIDLVSFITPKLGNGANTSYWDVAWCGDIVFKNLVHRLYALESIKNINVASKLSHRSLECSFKRNPRGGVVQAQSERLKKWKLIDNAILSKCISKTRWIKEVPIKINVHAWKVIHDCLPTRFNISRRGIEIESILCPMCECSVKSSRHLFFSCKMISDVMGKITRWWELEYRKINFFEDWCQWISSIRLPVKCLRRHMLYSLVVYLESAQLKDIWSRRSVNDECL